MFNRPLSLGKFCIAVTATALCAYNLAGTTTAFAQNNCSDATSISALQKIGADLDNLQTVVPQVSQQDADKAQKKMVDALQAATANMKSGQGMAQLSAAQGDPVFQAIVFHEQVKRAKSYLQKLLDDPSKDDNKAQTVFVVHAQVMKAKEAFHNCEDAKMVTADNATNGTALIMSIDAATNAYVQCAPSSTK